MSDQTEPSKEKIEEAKKAYTVGNIIDDTDYEKMIAHGMVLNLAYHRSQAELEKLKASIEDAVMSASEGVWLTPRDLSWKICSLFKQISVAEAEARQERETVARYFKLCSEGDDAFLKMQTRAEAAEAKLKESEAEILTLRAGVIRHWQSVKSLRLKLEESEMDAQSLPYWMKTAKNEERLKKLSEAAHEKTKADLVYANNGWAWRRDEDL